MKKKLLKERQRRKKELHEKHTNEAKQAGLDAKEVYTIFIFSTSRCY